MLDTFLVAMNDAEEYVAFLHTLSDMGAAMRSIFTRVVSNQHLYKELTMGQYTQCIRTLWFHHLNDIIPNFRPISLVISFLMSVKICIVIMFLIN